MACLVIKISLERKKNIFKAVEKIKQEIKKTYIAHLKAGEAYCCHTARHLCVESKFKFKYGTRSERVWFHRAV